MRALRLLGGYSRPLRARCGGRHESSGKAIGAGAGRGDRRRPRRHVRFDAGRRRRMLGLQRARRARRRTAGGQLDARPGVGARERRDVDCRRPPERVCNHSRRRRQMLGRDLLRCTRRWNDDAARDADRRSRAEQRRHRDRDRGVSHVRCSPERRHRLLGVERIRPARKPTTVDHARPVAVAGFGTATITVVSRHVLVTRERVAAVAVRCGSAQRCRGTLTLTTARTKLGSRRFSTPAGGARSIRVVLTRSGFARLVRAKRLSARVTVTGAAAASRTVMLVAPS